MEEIEFECPVCDDGKKHKAEVLKRERGKLERDEMKLIKGNVEVMIVRCKDCKRIGKIIRHLDYNFEIYDFPSDDESIEKLEKLASQ
ncbi:hypothetical protein [Archaeoglobus profundus]|uniref:Uncharacterized protein n=1 Tax=Archaeoglobus profundus (strain DSM 5631 / JCM 9629 / NBRC 100127 / Av18) TaxID=572546 RepID=D2RED3_ARCPA|nr:hypothetical protein [Archaeoglobus profundus]ADB58477.1 hypothetical protein Arcpr_1429 [Archaeoglobus profundus DSM 5631]